MTAPPGAYDIVVLGTDEADQTVQLESPRTHAEQRQRELMAAFPRTSLPPMDPPDGNHQVDADCRDRPGQLVDYSSIEPSNNPPVKYHVRYERCSGDLVLVCAATAAIG